VVGGLNIDSRHPTPIHAQLSHAIRGAVATGRLAAGEQLPTVRQLAVDLRINANTVARVYLELERTGVVETRRGIGTFVSARQPACRPSAARPTEALVERFLNEAAALGFDTDDVIRHLKQTIKDPDSKVGRLIVALNLSDSRPLHREAHTST
jgi:GntR family transcriptional regulator